MADAEGGGSKEKPERKPHEKRLWRTRRDLCDIFDCSTTHFDNAIAPLAWPKHKRKDPTRPGNPWTYYAFSLIEAWSDERARKRAKADKRPPPEEKKPSDLDELLAHGDSPALERWRTARAAHAELDLAERTGELCRVDDMEASWDLVANVLREAGEQMQRAGFHDAHEILNDAIDSAERLMIERFEEAEAKRSRPADTNPHQEESR